MPRFFFDVHDGRGLVKDQDGALLDGLDAAKREAVEAITEISFRTNAHREQGARALTLLISRIG